jgi:hypothetical protein
MALARPPVDVMLASSAELSVVVAGDCEERALVALFSSSNLNKPENIFRKS